jgi:nucleotide-binding universal stress UspA family protein
VATQAGVGTFGPFDRAGWPAIHDDRHSAIDSRSDKVTCMLTTDSPNAARDPSAVASRAAAGTNGVPAAAHQIRRVLLATDLTKASEVATDWAFALAERHGASLLVVSVIDPRELRQESERTGLRWDQLRDRRQTAAQELVLRGQPARVDVSVLVWTGDPGESIVSAAEAEAADLIVVGTHGRGTIGRLFLGSVSEYVMRNARCPVLVARLDPAASAR